MSDTAIIDVTFIDAETNEPFMALKVPMRQLPERDTALTIGKDDWLVVDVTPARAEEIVKAGKVSLVLRKVQYVDPKTILFSLPTVADEIPEETVEGELHDALLIVEDDWLQFELMPKEALPKAQSDLDAVRAVLKLEREGAGFKKLHVRVAVPSPFDGQPFLLSTLTDLFKTPGRLAYRGSPGPLKDCFAFKLPSGVWLYGQARAATVVALGLTAPDDEALGRLTGLTLIDWCAGQVYEAPHG